MQPHKRNTVIQVLSAISDRVGAERRSVDRRADAVIIAGNASGDRVAAMAEFLQKRESDL
jgi:hypothetical protein